MQCAHCDNSSSCFHCQCTVCGVRIVEQLPMRCLHCASLTHVGCARHALDGTPLDCTPDSPPPQPPVRSTSSPRGHSSLFPSNGTTQSGPFYCSPDCVLRVGLYANLNFEEALSSVIEAEAARRWAEVVAHRSPTSVDGRQPARDSPTPLSPSLKDFKDTEGGHFFRVAYFQLRYETWLRYFEQERLFYAHTVWLPPTHLAVSEPLLRNANELISAEGQARRLYMLSPETAPVGSVVALPDDKIWKEARSLSVGETNNHLVESVEQINRCTQEAKTSAVLRVSDLVNTKSPTT
ncbi:unnamed protein product [Phytomonas sp. Hart1]|nr:unnamed protein product [Phytomonas sp. Hart1]|eukprot:CCW69400.1 unnamed protein product [Phytomonas sp. isolate Hart1]